MGNITKGLVKLDKKAHSIVLKAETESAVIIEEANKSYNEIVNRYIRKAEEEKNHLFEIAKKEIETYRERKEQEVEKILSGFEKLSKENKKKFVEKVFNNLRGKICG